PEVVDHAVDVPRHGALEDKLLRLALALMQHAIADKALADADQHADLADFPGKLHRGGNHRLGRRGAAYDFEQAHDVGGREEMHTEHAFRPAGNASNLVDIEIRGV